MPHFLFVITNNIDCSNILNLSQDNVVEWINTITNYVVVTVLKSGLWSHKESEFLGGVRFFCPTPTPDVQ